MLIPFSYFQLSPKSVLSPARPRTTPPGAGTCGTATVGRRVALVRSGGAVTITPITSTNLPAASASASASSSSPPPIAPPTSYLCGACCRSFPRPSELGAHVEGAHCRERCSACGAVVVGRRLMEEHVWEKHTGNNNHGKAPQEDSTPCGVCHARFSRPAFLARHFHEHHVERSCALCLLPAKSREQLVRHVLEGHREAVEPPRPLYCRRCDEGFPDALGYKQHLRTRHPLAERTVNAAAAAASSPALPGGPVPAGTKKAAATVALQPSTNKQPQRNQPDSALVKPVTRPAGATTMAHRCPKCSHCSSQKGNLQRHFEAFHVTFTCRSCGLNAVGRKGMVEHVRECHPGADDRYDISDARDPVDRALLNTIKDLPKVPCVPYQQETSSERKGERYSCRFCRFATSDYSSWIRHKCSDLRRNPQGTSAGADIGSSSVCPWCNDPFPNRSLLAYHITSMHGVAVSAHSDSSIGRVRKRRCLVEPGRRRRKRKASRVTFADEEDEEEEENLVVDVDGDTSTSFGKQMKRQQQPASNNNSDTDSVPESLVGAGPGCDEDMLAPAFVLVRQRASAAAQDEKAEYLRSGGFDEEEGGGGGVSDLLFFDAALRKVMRQSETAVAVQAARTCLDGEYSALRAAGGEKEVADKGEGDCSL